jgi:hypothetical protein
MEEERLAAWGDFEDRVENGVAYSTSQPPLYRGQRNSRWTLTTTLERYGVSDCSVADYRKIMYSAASAVETVTGGGTWPYEGDLEAVEDKWLPPPGYPLMAFLRQNGFPSPLLDWSRSPYVAAFFAFTNANPEESECVAIYEYQEYGVLGKVVEQSEALICSLGPWIATDKKHFLQQSEYTLCRKGSGSLISYASHEEVFSRNEEGQDLLVKYLIPVSEKELVLKRLRRYNINSYSLFESTQALMEMLAVELVKKS